jgi:hypothetical protein
MAIITSAATGNFSAGATWVGGVVPTVGDTARAAAGHVITIDVNTTCDAIESLNTSGYFLLPNGITLTANVTGGATIANNGTLRLPSSAVANIVGSVSSTQGTANTVVVLIDNSGVELTINGNVFNNVIAANSPIWIAAGGSSSKLTINGNVSANVSATNGYTINVLATGVLIDVLGDVTGNSVAATAVGIRSTANTQITVTGDILGSASSGILSNETTGSITVTGNVTGGGGLSGHGIEANGDISVTGEVRSTVGAGILCTSSADIDIVGTLALNSSATSATVVAPANSSCIVDGPIELEGGRWPLAVLFWSLRDSDTTVQVNTENDGVVTYVNEDDVNGMPAELDVRDGTVYGALGGLEGTLAVPDPQFVFPGIPTDDTVGTGDLIGAVADVTGAQIAAAITAIP